MPISHIVKSIPWTSKPDTAPKLARTKLTLGLQVCVGNFPTIQDVAQNGLKPSAGSGSPADITTPEGRARAYTADSDFFTTPKALDNVTEYTYLVFADFKSFSSWGWSGLFAKTSDLTTTNGFQGFRNDSSGVYQIQHQGNNVNLSNLSTELGNGGFFRAVIRWDGARATTYKDGWKLDDIAYTTSVTSGAGYAKILSNRDSYTAIADHVLTLVWDRALSDAEIVAVSANPYMVFQPQTRYIPVGAAPVGAISNLVGDGGLVGYGSPIVGPGGLVG